MKHHLPQNNHNAMRHLLQPILESGQEGILQVLKKLLDETMLLEREASLQASHYERSEDRQGYANGYKDKTFNTRMGTIDLKVPQTRNMPFYPSCLEKGLRSEKAINAAIAEMYIQGVSTRKVTKILKELCDLEISSSQVSRITAELDEELQAWRDQSIGEIPILIVDARYEKVRYNKSIRSMSVLIAYGITSEGKRRVLGVSTSLSEAEIHWRQLFKNLTDRGLNGLKLIVSDAHEGLANARISTFGSTPWQRCYFHLMQNAQSYIPTKMMVDEVNRTIKEIFAALTKERAQELLNKAVTKYEKTAPQLSQWMEYNIPEGFTFFDFNHKMHSKIRTSNLAELRNKELKRRTRVINIFPNQESLLRIVSAILMELDEEWLSTNKSYIAM